MAQIITGLGRVVTAGVADAVVDGVMPVVIVIGICSVPTTVMRLERVMSPANTGVGASHHYSLASKAECPYLRRVRVIDPRLDGLRSPATAGLRRRLNSREGFREVILDVRIAFNSRHVRPRCQRLSDLTAPFH